MNILSLRDAEKLPKIIVPEDNRKIFTTAEERAKCKYWIRKIYETGFAICYPENILWDSFETMMEDLVEKNG